MEQMEGRESSRPRKDDATGGNRVIRQAISCDICGTEKKQTNHWFVAYDQGEELRVSGWNSRNRLRPGSKHLCGQTCLHKLVDDFLARALTSRMPRNAHYDAEDELIRQAVKTDTSLTTVAASKEIASSTRLIATPALVSPTRPPLRMQMELVTMPAKSQAEEIAVAVNEPPRYTSRNWRAAAWERERERERELRVIERHPGLSARRRYST
jgi:hypothetical protein